MIKLGKRSEDESGTGSGSDRPEAQREIASVLNDSVPRPVEFSAGRYGSRF
jgi:hypothetical protein